MTVDAPIVTPIAQAVPSGKPVRAFDSGRVTRMVLELLRSRGPIFLIGSLFLVVAPAMATHWVLLQIAHMPPGITIAASLGVTVADAVAAAFFIGLITLVAVADATGQRQTPMTTHIARLLSIGLPLAGAAVLSILGIYTAMILLIVPGVMLSIAWYVALPAAAVERLGPRAALGRSLKLTRGARWPIFALVAAVSMVLLISSFTIDQLASGGARFGQFARVPLVGYGVAPVLNAITQTILGALAATIYMELARIHEHLGSRSVAEVFA